MHKLPCKPVLHRWQLAARGLRPVALNFANATNPGGGFLGGATAQEESLCWATGLYACLLGNPMYAFHQEHDDGLYTDYVIYSPDVPVFRSDVGALLAAPGHHSGTGSATLWSTS